MKKRYLKTVAGLLVVAAVWFGASTNLYATLNFSNPLSLNSAGVIGTATGITGGANGTVATETTIAQELLALGHDASSILVGIGNGTTPDSNLATSSTDYTDTGILFGAYQDTSGGTYVPSGYAYVLGKYDGHNAGYILFYLGGEDANIPTLPYNIFGNVNDTGFALSNFTAFNPTSVPEPTTVVAGLLLLVPLGLSTVRIVRRNRVK